MAFQYLLYFLSVAATFVFIFFRYRHSGSFKILGFGFLLKAFAGFVLVWVYTEVYPKRQEADVFKYYDDGLILDQVRHENLGAYSRIVIGTWTEADVKYLDRMNYWFRSYDHGLSNDNRIIIRVNAILNLFTGGQYGLNMFCFVLLSFIGTFYLFKFFQLFSNHSLLSFLAAFCVPSTLFWSSGILKESLLMLGIGCFLFSLLQVLLYKKWTFLWITALCLTLLFQLKIYVILTMIPFVVIGITFYFMKNRWWATGLSLGLLLALFLFQNQCISGWDLLSSVQGKQFDFMQMAREVHAGSQIPMPALEHSYGSLLGLYPLGIWNVFYYPEVSMLKNPMAFAAFAENVLIWTLVLCCVILLFRKIILPSQFYLFLGFVLLIFGLIGITTPVVGAMVRYKAPVLPFLVFFLLNSLLNNVKSLKFKAWVQKLNSHL